MLRVVKDKILNQPFQYQWEDKESIILSGHTRRFYGCAELGSSLSVGKDLCQAK